MRLSENRVALRQRVLEELYRLSRSDVLLFVLESDLAAAVELSEETVERFGGELVGAGLATFPETGPVLAITYAGIRRVELAIAADPENALLGEVDKRRRARLELLTFLYKASGPDPHRSVSDFAGLPWPIDELYAHAGYLADRGFVVHSGHDLAITPLGIRAVEESGTDASLRF